MVSDRSLRGAEFCRVYSKQVDDWLKELFESAGGASCSAALAAVGGYGRAELSPHSDLDVWLLYDESDGIEELAVGLWHPIWDEGLKLGHAVRTIPETLKLAEKSLDTSTALLSLRHLAGDAALSRRLKTEAERRWMGRAKVWLPRLVEDSRKRGRQFGEVAFRLQPDLKDATGGLRDMQALEFAARARPNLLGADVLFPEESYRTILAARVELHRVSANSSNLLALEYQDEVAEALGFPSVEEFMTEVSAAGRTAAWLVDNTWARIEEEDWDKGSPRRRSGSLKEISTGVYLLRREVFLAPEVRVDEDPMGILRVAAAAAAHDARIELGSLQRLADAPPLGERWPEGGRELFVRLLASGRSAIPVIESLDQVGAMVKILPEWEFCRCLLQRNDYHRYTVDRHLCEAAAQAAAIVDRGDEVGRSDLLLIAAFLHDIGKGVGGDHSKVGMEIVEKIATRMGFDEADTAILVKLVELHLLLPDVATRRNIEDVGTVLRVAAEVGSVDVLRLLAALTEADSIATGPSVWSNWKAKLIRGLVRRTEHYLLGGKLSELPRSFPTPEVLERMHEGELFLEAEKQQILAIVPQNPAVLPVLAGVITLNGLSVISAVGCVDAGMTAYLLLVDSPWPDSRLWQRVIDDARAAFDGGLALEDRLARLTRVTWTSESQVSAPQPIVGTFVKFDNDVSADLTVLELAAPDSKGLLHRITSTLVDAGLLIKRARVQTLGDHVVDSFDLTEESGEKLTDPARLKEIADLVTPVIRDAPRHQRVRRENLLAPSENDFLDDGTIYDLPSGFRRT